MPLSRLTTVKDFIDAYGDEEMGRRAFAGLSMLAEGDSFTKADNPLLTTTSGSFATMYGPELWAQMNLQATAFGAQAKIGYPKRFGWRVLTGFPTNKVVWSADAGAVADTEILPFAQVYNTPKLAYKNYDAGLIQQYAAADGQAVDWQAYRDAHGDIISKGVNAALLQDVDVITANAITPIDRIVSANTELSCGITAGDADLYNIDRDAGAGWSDATVLHNSNVDRPFDLSLVNTLKRTVDQACGISDVGQRYWLTKPDTWQRWGESIQPQQRFSEAKFSTSAVNGIQSAAGQEGGFTVSDYMGHPIVTDPDVAYDTLGRVYYLNTKYLKFGAAIPMKNIEVGGLNDTLLLLGKFATEGMFYLAGDELCYAPFTMGKVRDML